MRVISHKSPHFATFLKILPLSLSLSLSSANVSLNIPFPETHNLCFSIFVHVLFYVFRLFTSHFDMLLIIQSVSNLKILILLKFKTRYAKCMSSVYETWYCNTTIPIPFKIGRYLHRKPSQHVLIRNYSTMCRRLEKVMDNTEILRDWN